jgi:adenosine deaminase
MLGNRGVRLGISVPEVTEMQARAIFEAAVGVAAEGRRRPAGDHGPAGEHGGGAPSQDKLIREVAARVFEEAGREVAYLVGTMIELPRAALTADRIAEAAEFFSFGTNDLTQTTYGISRDDAGSFLPLYIEQDIFPDDPFQVLDQEGVGQLVALGTRKGRATRPDLKVGICGEHGGEPRSVASSATRRASTMSPAPPSASPSPGWRRHRRPCTMRTMMTPGPARPGVSKRSARAVEPMVGVTRDRIRRLPKTDLHVHLDGSVRPETLIELADERGVELPARDPAALADYMHVQDARDLVDYLSRFDITLSVMQDAESLERIAFELAEDAAAENVRYMEVRFSPVLNVQDGLTLEDAVAAPLRGLRRAEQAFGIRTGIIICGIRNMSPHTSMDLADLTVQFKRDGVVAFDLAGAEYNNPAKMHREAFYRVGNANVAATIHAGEAYGPESIHQALHYCNANRIGHGTRLFEDPDLMEYVNDFRIPIEICITSNVQTRAVERFEDHPVRLYYDEGIVVTLNTDNRLMSATTVTEEYWRAHEHLGFTWEELGRIALYGFDSAFLPHREKRALVPEIRREIDALTEEFAHQDATAGAGAS